MMKWVYAVLGFFALIASAWGGVVVLGLDTLAPVPRGEYELHVAGAAGQDVDNLLRWQGQYQQQRIESEVRAEEWKERNPGKPLPDVYRLQRRGIIEQIESITREIETIKKEK